MKRLIAALAALGLFLATSAPALAAEELPHTGRVLIAIEGDVELPSDEQADVVLVVDGHAEVHGVVNTAIVIDGSATISGATLETLVVISGTADVSNTTILGDIRTFDSQVAQTDVSLGGSVRGLEADFAAMASLLGLGALLVWIGVGLATLVFGLAIAGLAGRQVRATTALMRREPGMAAVAGLLGLVVPPIVGVLLMVTVVGIPLGIGLLVVVWPGFAFVGYVVAAIWLGEWVLRTTRGEPIEADRPYLAAFVGLLIAFVLGFVPLVTAVMSFFGLGAVLLAAWRAIRGGRPAEPVPVPQPAALPS